MPIILDIPEEHNPDYLNLDASIYDELSNYRQDNLELKNCINDTVDSLLNQTKGPDNMYRPVCLLGKIQSGKTRAFIGAIAKAFDRGVNTVIILTKNSTLLGKQTTKRVENELHSIGAGRAVAVNYITDIDGQETLGIAEITQKRVIVGIKHHKNVGKIINYVVRQNSALSRQPILIVDDEADVSAIGYRRVYENVPFETLPEDEQTRIIEEYVNRNEAELPLSVRQERVEMLHVAENIDVLRRNLPEHYYLQVTATPASIFLQPEEIVIQNYNEDYSIENISRAPLMSDKTILLPIHEEYIGGEFFFLEDENPESMAQFCFREVNPDELQLMMHRDLRHIKNIFKSGNFPQLTEFVDNILLAVAANVASILQASPTYLARFDREPLVLLNAIKTWTKGFSAMIHTSTAMGVHRYQTELVESYIAICKEIVRHNPENLIERLKTKLSGYYFNSILESFNLFKNHPKYPGSYLNHLDSIDFDFVFTCYNQILVSDHIRVFIINSDVQMEARIDPESGELKRDVLANIYIGGQSLDRGITLQRMVGFFYGREPQVAQLDTTLQHARIYGARKPEDLVFTRLYCSINIYNRLREITQIDGVLRQSIINNDGNNRFAAIELGANGTIRPTNPNRIMISNCINLKSHKRFLPLGFNTRLGKACEHPMQTIDEIITRHRDSHIPDFNRMGLRFITWEVFREIFTAFMNGMISIEKWDANPDANHWSMDKLEAFYHLIRNSYFKNDDRIILSVKRGRSINRLHIDGRFMDTPETARTDTAEMKDIMLLHNVPGLFLFEQEGLEDIQGDKNYGWNGQRFYWPLLMLPSLGRNIMVSLDAFQRGQELEN